MKIYVVLLVGIAGLLSACGGGLQSEQTALEPQRVDSCTYQGGVFRSGESVRADASANCTVIRNGYDNVSAFTSLQYARSKEGSYFTLGNSQKTTIPARSPSTYNIGFSHIGVERYCSADREGVWYRAKMTIQWRNNAGTLGGTTVYYSPKRNDLC